MKRTKLRLVAAVFGLLAALVWSLAGAPSAQADTMGTCTGGVQPCWTDNSSVAWCLSASLNGYPDLKSAAAWAISTLDSQTILTTTQASECTDATDVRFVRKDLPTGILGQAVCEDWHGGTTKYCYAATVYQSLGNQVDALTDATAYPPSDGNDEAGELVRNFKKTWCHELGHTVGLRHHPDGDTLADREAYYDGSGGEHEQDCLVRFHIELDQNWLRYNVHHQTHIAHAY